MTVLGVLDAIRPVERSASERIVPARPGNDGAPLLKTSGTTRTASVQDSLADARFVDAERSRDRALRRVAANRSSTSLAGLAQALASLGNRDGAVDAAREALDLSVRTSGDAVGLNDPSSARIAAEVLMRFDSAADAYEVLRQVPLNASMCVTFAQLATAVGDTAAAEEVLVSHGGPLVNSFRGYLYASEGRWQEAVHCLRQAVNEESDDADALLNLSIALWNLGSTRKATRVALQATRTAPGRKDISLHYLEVLLAQNSVERVVAEIKQLRSSGVIADAALLEVQARARLACGDMGRGIALLTQAVEAAKSERNRLVGGTAAGNLALLRYRAGRITRDEASRQLGVLLHEFPDNDAIAVNFAEIARSRREAETLREAIPRIETTPIRRAYLRHQLAILEGDTDAAAAAASDWFELEPDNSMAAMAAIVAVGIGQNRWTEATTIADYALSKFSHDPVLVNNSAYVLAMGGRAEEAIQLLEPIAGDDFILMATLGLAHLANNDIGTGMRLYRKAADIAEKVDPAWRSLMTAYQALVVRQLGIDTTSPPELLAALALVPFDLPEDWSDRPDFLRIQHVCQKNGYEWPLSVDGLTTVEARRKIERQERVVDAVHSGLLEGREPGPHFAEDASEYIDGKIDADEVVRRARERYGLE